MYKYIGVFLLSFLLFSCTNTVDNNENINDNTGSVIDNSQTNIGEDNLGNEDNNTIDETGNNKTGSWVASEYENGYFSLEYPNDLFEEGHEPKFYSGACESNNIENIKNIIPELEAYSSGSIEGEERKINGYDFLTFKTQDAATGHVYTSYYYSNFDNSSCFVTKIETSRTNCDFYLPIEDGNEEQQSNYDNCIERNNNESSIISQIEATFDFNK